LAAAGLQRITLHECRQVISAIAGHELKHGGAQVTAR
jgi:hypothetical protein